MATRSVDPEALYVSFTRGADDRSSCTVVLPSQERRLRFDLDELDAIAPGLDPTVADVCRRAAPALPEGRRVGIMVKAPATKSLVSDGPSAPETEPWDPASGRFYEESSIPFDDLMLCVEKKEHHWRYHAFAKQDRCTRCQVLKDGTYL